MRGSVRYLGSACAVSLLFIQNHVWCSNAVLSTNQDAHSGPHIELLEPAQGFVSGDGTLRATWAAKEVPSGGSKLKIVLMVNGLTAHVTEFGSETTSTELNELADGSYRLHIFLGEYDEIEGLSNVQSSALVECWVDNNGMLGAVAPVNPQERYEHFVEKQDSCLQLLFHHP